MADELVRMENVSKYYGRVRALDGATFKVNHNEIVGLLGDNGAGKSTLIKVLSGAHQPDSGEITWLGETVSLSSPTAAIKQGVSTIYQELDLVPGLSVAENIFLGHEPNTYGITNRSDAKRRAQAIMSRLGHGDIRVTREVGTLSAASQQIVSMARALSQDARLLIMDEPSAALGQEEVANLFRVIREITAEGVAVVYISHRLEEIREIGDRVTVLKDGRTVAAGLDAKETTTREFIQLMTGRDIEYVFPERRAADESAPVTLDVEGLSLAPVFDNVSFQVRAGEIVGLAGLVGSGRSEILESIFGARKATAGTVSVDGHRLPAGSVVSAVRAGIGLAPEERKSQGLLLDQAVAHNITISTLDRFATAGFIDRGGEREAALESVRSLDVRPAGVDRAVRTLSGGNQQKVVLARWLLRDCRVLLLDEPTRGVDVGARTEIYGLVQRLASEGVAVVVVSSEVEEVLGLADRVLVIREGVVVHEGPTNEIDEHGVLDLVMEGSVA